MIRTANPEDWSQIWPIFKAIAQAGETYAYPRDITEEAALQVWMQQPRRTFVYEKEAQILGTYYLKTNQQGPGSHVCNCGYMVAEFARGQGIASALCEHSIQQARSLGYLAMQYNFVASTNEEAVRLWQKMGFSIVGRLPKAFRHPHKGLVDALVMYQWLDR